MEKVSLLRMGVALAQAFAEWTVWVQQAGMVWGQFVVALFCLMANAILSAAADDDDEWILEDDPLLKQQEQQQYC